MDHNPGPVMVCLPGEVSTNKWINQKFNPMQGNRSGAWNTKEFKDFLGGQLFVEHASSPVRLKLSTVKLLIVDELTEFAENLKPATIRS